MYRMRSYTRGHKKIQPFVIATLAFASVVAGCARVNVPIGSNNVDTPTVLTGSVSSSADQAYSDISAEDRSIIAENLDTLDTALSASDAEESAVLSWQNPTSGNSGTLTDLNADSLGETGCVSFKTTANTIAGIRLYSGTACRDITQKFSVTTLSVADA